MHPFFPSLPFFRSGFLLLGGALVGMLFLFSCSEKPAGTEKVKTDSLLSYVMQEKIGSLAGCNPDSGSCTYMRLNYPRFSGVSGPLADSLQHLIAQTFEVAQVNDAVLDSITNNFLKEYQTNVNYFPGKEGPRWNVDMGLEVVRINKKWICMEEACFGYTGGAHDFGVSQYHTLDLATGRELHLADFFDSTGLKKLTRLGEKYFALAWGIKDSQTWEEAGFTFENDQFYLPENFCFQEAGLQFIFNSYEIGPYVLGASEFIIPANEIVPLMKKENRH